MGMIPPPGAMGQMSDPFDPYRKWLGIPPRDRPPHHYRLLGIATFESDPDVIENAANRQMAHVRTYKNSKHAALSQKILTELSAAKLCLLTPDHKESYDAQLRAQLAAAGKLSDSVTLGAAIVPADDRWRVGEEPPPTSAPPPVPIPMPVGTAVEPAPTVPIIRRGGAAAIRARKQRSALPLALTVVSLCVLFAAAGVAALVASGVLPGSGRSPSKASQRPSAPAPRADKAPGNEQPGVTAFPIGAAHVVAKPIAQASQSGDAIATAAMPAIDRARQALFQAQQALAARDDEAVARHLATAESLLATGAIDQPQVKPLREEIEHWRNLGALVGQFWKGVSDNVTNTLHVGEKFTFFGSELALVAREAGRIEVTLDGQSHNGELGDLDPRAAAVIAARTVNLSQPASLLPVVAFLAIDERAGRDHAGDAIISFARRFFQDNRLAGEQTADSLAALGAKFVAEMPLDEKGVPLPKP